MMRKKERELALIEEEAMHARILNARPAWRAKRRKVLALDNHTCRMCSFNLCLEVHHILPLAEGGRDTIGNLVTLCPNHHAMADRGLITSEQFARCLARRSAKGRFPEMCELLEYVARTGAAAGADPQKAAAVEWSLRAELRERLASIYGAERVSASLDSFLRIPPDDDD